MNYYKGLETQNWNFNPISSANIRNFYIKQIKYFLL